MESIAAVAASDLRSMVQLCSVCGTSSSAAVREGLLSSSAVEARLQRRCSFNLKVQERARSVSSHVGLRAVRRIHRRVAGSEDAAPVLVLVVGGRSRSSDSWKNLQVVSAQFAESTAVNAVEEEISSKCVLVVGVTGGVGQLVAASLLEKGVQVRGILRTAEKAKVLFGDQIGDKFQFHIKDLRQRESLDASIFEGVTHIICCTGTTAFPSNRWDGNNGPEQTDWLGVRNLIDAIPPTIQKFVLVSSVGVTKYDQIPWNIMNLFGVLKYKKMGEDHLRKSGLPYTIIRAGRLTDGPYTSYDLNTLLKATAGKRHSVILGQGDKLVGEASRVAVAEACVHALDLEFTNGQTYELSSVEGEGPGKDFKKWESLFQAARLPAA